MARITSVLAFLWVLSLPFYNFSLIGSFSLDNLMAPILFVFILLRNIIDEERLTSYQMRNLILEFSFAALYFFAHTVGLIFTKEAVWSSAYAVATNMLYFILPVMFVRTHDDLRKCNNAMILAFFIASISALLAALGMINFEFSRYAESRIGVDALQKSVGVISSYGDVGIMLTLSLLLVISARKDRILFGRGSYYKITMVIVVSVIGIASMQSRNVLLTLVTSLLTYWVLTKWMKKDGWPKKMYISVFLAVTLSVIIVVIFSGPLLDIVQSVGGTKEAAGTVGDRLAQYDFMLKLLNDQYLMGVRPDVYERYQHEIGLIHNLWLKELVQGGVFSVMTMFMLWWRALVIQVQNYQRGIAVKEARVYLTVLIGVLIATQFYPAGTLIFWAILGLCSVTPSSVQKHEKSESRTRASEADDRVLFLHRAISNE